MSHYDCPLCGEYGCLRTCKPDNVAWLKAKIKEASDNADLVSFEDYTAMLKHWEAEHG
tara:strand:- start:509 stop:682 length:174 start_codon:yes stop_codon:yes gene_type:complete